LISYSIQCRKQLRYITLSAVLAMLYLVKPKCFHTAVLRTTGLFLIHKTILDTEDFKEFEPIDIQEHVHLDTTDIV
jgi:hypothetical protein